MEHIHQCVTDLNTSFHEGKTLPIEWRKNQLRQLWHLVTDNQDQFIDAAQKDLARPKVLTQAVEILPVQNDIVHCLKNLDDWLKEEEVSTAPPFEHWSPTIRRRPKGTCLVMGTWNYPVLLSLLPFIGVIAAGNTGIIRPSEYAPHTADLLAMLFPKYLDNTCFRCVIGGKEAAVALLEHQFGHIMFTGSATVGKEIMKSAAKFLTPVTLELGGQNAVVVSDKANVPLAAKRTLWAKFINAGQTCFAPNVAIVHEAVYEEFLSCAKEVYAQFYNDSPELAKVGRIVNAAQWNRITSILPATKGHIILGGKIDESQLYIEPTVVRDVLQDDALLQAEIFGPVLPVMRCTDMTHAKEMMRSVSVQALGFYILSEDLEEANDMVNTVQAGSAAINDVMAQIAPTSLPFGGFGHSGHGAYRGKASIDTFSHKLSLVKVPTSAEFETMLEWRYPYSESDETVNFIRKNLQAELP